MELKTQITVSLLNENEMEKDVIEELIKLYVNDFSKNLGKSGEHAIEKLFEISRQKGLIPQCNKPLFAC
jgi:1,4-dihydroxy-6-naphthoate synthase